MREGEDEVLDFWGLAPASPADPGRLPWLPGWVLPLAETLQGLGCSVECGATFGRTREKKYALGTLPCATRSSF